MCFQMLFILVVGMPGAGKGIIVDIARERFNLKTYTMGDVIREEALRKYGEITPETMLKVSREVREKYGSQYVAIKTYERIDRSEKVVLIDGVRSLDEVEYFRKHGETIIIAIHASPRTRFERLLKRGRVGDPRNWEEFVERDMIELSFGIGNVIALADYMIVNEGDIEEVRREVENVLRKIIGGRLED